MYTPVLEPNNPNGHRAAQDNESQHRHKTWAILPYRNEIKARCNNNFVISNPQLCYVSDDERRMQQRVQLITKQLKVWARRHLDSADALIEVAKWRDLIRASSKLKISMKCINMQRNRSYYIRNESSEV